MKKSVLMVVSREFLPANSGRKTVLSTVHNIFCSLGYAVDIFFIDSLKKEGAVTKEIYEEGAELRARTKVLSIINRSPLKKVFGAAFGFLLGKSLNESLFYSKSIGEELNKSIEKNSYNFIYFDMIRGAQYIEGIQKKVPFVIDFDDLLSRRYSDGHTKVGLLGYYGNSLPRIVSWVSDRFSTMLLEVESRRVKKVEKLFIAKASACTFVSDIESNLVRKLYPEFKSKVFSAPMAFVSNNITCEKVRPKKSKYKLLMVGNFFYGPNLEALHYCAKYVFPLLQPLKSKIQVEVVGQLPSLEIENLKFDYVTAHGYVDNLAELFCDCDIMLFPIFGGSGIKTKVIESFSYGLPVLGNVKTFEGIVDKKTHISLNSSRDIVNYIFEMVDGKKEVELFRLRKIVLDYFLANHSYEAVRSKWEEIIGFVERHN